MYAVWIFFAGLYQVFISLLFGIWLGWMIINNFHPLVGTFETVQALVDVFKDAGNTFPLTVIMKYYCGYLTVIIV